MSSSTIHHFPDVGNAKDIILGGTWVNTT